MRAKSLSRGRDSAIFGRYTSLSGAKGGVASGQSLVGGEGTSQVQPQEEPAAAPENDAQALKEG